MNEPSTTLRGVGGAHYLAIVAEAAAGGAALMGALIKAARTTLYSQEKSARDLPQRDLFAASLQLLDQREAAMCAAYPLALFNAFKEPETSILVTPHSVAEVNFDELELMDELQVQSSVVKARAQQYALLVAEAGLAELNTLICGVLGLKSVRPERNPLRPEVYVNALKDVIEGQNIPTPTQLEWVGIMGIALGQELREMYVELALKLRKQGVVAAGYVVRQTGGGSSRRANFELETAGKKLDAASATFGDQRQSPSQVFRSQRADPTLLTLDKLRRLLSGDLNPVANVPTHESFEQKFAREFESEIAADLPATTDFDSTVPAALEALQEMRQLDHVLQRLEDRKTLVSRPDLAGSQAAVVARESMQNGARDVVQALSLEVAALMIDNIARDARLLDPVQRLVRSLEPAYLRLSLIDARLFTDKQHPARSLLHEITHRSMAYRSATANGFKEFLTELEAEVLPLIKLPIDSAIPFERVLAELKSKWQRAAIVSAQAREEVVEVLQHVERRNVLAEKIARDIASHRDAASVPAVVMDFLCGPWAQVVAQARLEGGTGSANADKYQALISALLWSTHPELTRNNISKLTRLVPLLLSTLREGVETIKYPGTKTATFFESLMGLHQLAFRGVDHKIAVPLQAPPGGSVSRKMSIGEDLWVAPEEAKASNFVQLPEESVTPSDADLPLIPEGDLLVDDLSIATTYLTAEILPKDDLPLGSWVELLADGQWVRTQLTWASPHATLFLFTSALGTSQSMTRRSRDRLVAAGNLRVISGTPVVDGALNAVAQLALRNSVGNAS